MNDVYQRIYDIVKRIPPGRVATYGDIACCIGTKGGARLVGWALNASRNALEFIPAHRVVNRNGILTGKRHFDGRTLMQDLLENEGLVIVDDQITDFDKHYWNPVVELNTELL
jgi:methylated-DNA-protein-cysteine methyltransferase related protein